MTLRLIGAGLSRTDTSSLREALRHPVVLRDLFTGQPWIPAVVASP